MHLKRRFRTFCAKIEKMLTRVLLLHAFLGFALCDNVPKLRYYFSSMDDYKELPLDFAHDIFRTSWYNSNRSTVIFAHGFTGHPQGPAVIAVIKSYLERGDCNVVLLNWQEMAAAIHPTMPQSYVNWAAPNARKLGGVFADILLSLSQAGMDLNNTLLVGHSLGAHIFGLAGNALAQKGIVLPWIIGLDPAGVGFEGRPPAGRLNPGSAGFVTVIHSDPSKYGFRRALGTVDFWPNYKINGAVEQPGCDGKSYPMFSLEDLCNHNRSWQLLVDAMKHPGTLIGSYAKNYRKWKNGSKEEREAITLEIAVYDKNTQPGDYFLTTSSKAPFGLAKDGL